MNDVFRQVVLAKGDEDLGAHDPELARVRPFGNGRGRGAQGADVRAGLRLGEVHRARPGAADEPGQEPRLLLGAAMVVQRFDRADSEHWQQGKAHVCSAQGFKHACRQREGQALAAKRHRPIDCAPALLDKCGIGLGKACRQRDGAVGPLRALFVARAVKQRPFALRQGADAVRDRVHHICRCGGKAFVLGELVDSGANAHGKDLVGSGRREGHCLVFLGSAGVAL